MKKTVPKKDSKKTSPKRRYDNSLRAQKSAEKQKLILETMVEMLVERRGREVAMEELAKRSGISERSLFRFFKNRQALNEALDAYLGTFLQASQEQMTELNFVGFAKNAYTLFDKYENLVLAYLFSDVGREARVLLRRKLNQAMIDKIVAERPMDVTPDCRKRLAIVTSLVNAKIWHDLKVDYGFSGEDIKDTVGWALETLLAHCND